MEKIAELTGFLLNKNWISFYKGDHEVNVLPELPEVSHHLMAKIISIDASLTLIDSVFSVSRSQELLIKARNVAFCRFRINLHHDGIVSMSRY